MAVRSGHKIGKSTTVAILALWWASDPEARPAARVILTAPTGRQVRSILWREVKRLYRRARERGKDLGGDLHKDPNNGVQWEDGREIVGFSTDEPEKMAGFSGAHLLFLVDEASGVLEEIYEAVEGNRAGGAKIVLFGNPTQTSGEFYDAFGAKAEFYGPENEALFTISSEDTPNVREGRDVIPGLATRAWVEEKKEEWGEDDPRYRVRVKGEPPNEGLRNVLGEALVRAAMTRVAPESGALRGGLDPAREGDDDSSLCLGRGLRTYPLVKLPKGDGPTVGAFALAEIKRLRRPGEIVRLNVDAIGLGTSPLDWLRRCDAAQEGWLKVIPVNSASKPPPGDPQKEYANLRAFMSFAVKDHLLAGGSLPNDPRLKAELVAPEYSFDTQNRILVQKKEDVKKRLGGRSPDRADALALRVYEAPDISALVRVMKQTRPPARPPRSTW